MVHQSLVGKILITVALFLISVNQAATQPLERIGPPREVPPLPLRLQVPSEAAGKEGVAVRVSFPAKARYGADGAPVVVVVPGGLGAGNVNAQEVGVEAGFVCVQFAFPGGLGSGGTADQRGQRSLEALKDVIRFAMGEKTDSAGKTLQQYAGHLKVLTRNVGLLGLSNGGNQALVIAGLHGERMRDLAWIVNWESPVGPGMVNGELGTYLTGLRPGAPPEEKGNPLVNPAYDPDAGKLDLTKLAYDATLEVQPFPSRAGKPDKNAAPLPRGGLYFDINGNGKVDPGVDFLLRPLVVMDKRGPVAVYSVRLHQEAEARKLYGEKRPEHIAASEEAIEFWKYRDGLPWVKDAVANCPRLMFLIIAGARDHMQSAPDHPHIRMQYDAFREGSAWFTRLNPDLVYVQALSGKGVKAVNNLAREPFDTQTIRKAVEPELGKGGSSVRMLQIAALCELADRTQRDSTAPKLEAVLYPVPFIPERPGKP